jgi:hypothetical protein
MWERISKSPFIHTAFHFWDRLLILLFNKPSAFSRDNPLFRTSTPSTCQVRTVLRLHVQEMVNIRHVFRFFPCVLKCYLYVYQLVLIKYVVKYCTIERTSSVLIKYWMFLFQDGCGKCDLVGVISGVSGAYGRFIYLFVVYFTTLFQ